MANIRSSSNNPFQLKHHTKTNYNTHFERVIIPANFLQRHGVILCKISVYMSFVGILSVSLNHFLLIIIARFIHISM